MAAQQVYEFTFWIDDAQRELVEWSNALYEAGADDSHPGYAAGVPYVGFSREAPTLDEAIGTARQCVESAGLKVLRCEIDEQQLATLH